MSKKETIKPWLPKCDLEDFGLFLYEYNNAEYGTLNWGKPSFVDFCKRNNIQQKGTKKKIKQLNHFWFSANTPKGQKINDIAHHFLRHIRNAYAHCNVQVVQEGRHHHRYYKLKDYEINGTQSMSGKIRKDFLWEMVNELLSSSVS